jgi:hypothetical protein
MKSISVISFNMMKENKILLFLDDFDEIMMQRTAETDITSVILKLRNLFFIISLNLKKKV